MEKNVGTVDKVIRGILAIVFGYLGYVYSFWLYLISAILIVTIVTGNCMIYRLIGANTCKTEKIKNK